ncbi:MAG TPA: nickel pincer cofactor biosynthesis protein LarB [Tepidisphaeraceae bacterium]
MNVDQIRALLAAVASGEATIETALQRLRALPFENLEFATVDHHRQLRCGHPEVIFCHGKTVEQVMEIAKRLAGDGAGVLATRASAEQQAALRREFPGAIVNEIGRGVLIESQKNEKRETTREERAGHVTVVCAGTSDLPVAEEAALTLRSMRVPVVRINDVGVSGLHRLFPHVERLQASCAVVAIAGMEGALPSVIGGLVACPVFAVPTSVGYGANLGGLAAMLGMLNSCASNISVVNIDNGFGAAYSAGLVWQQVRKAAKEE